MKSLRHFTIAATCVLGFMIAAFSFAGHAFASGNVRGFAWSESAGWISMNCDNSMLTDGNAMPSTCGTVDYGVTVNETSGAMSGYGWSSNLGWVRFDQVTSTPTYIPNRAGSARITGIGSGGVRRVTGWIRFCSDFNQAIMPDNCGGGGTITSNNGGWNGWVSMMGDGSDGSTPYGVTYDTATKTFDGYAWGGTFDTSGAGSEVVGWIMFKWVYVDKDATPYVPVVKISAVTPIPVGGDTTISYYWVNADSDPTHKITSCTAYTDQGQVANWNSSAFTSGNLPTATVQMKQYVAAFNPTTIYYLDCKNASGIKAADPSNPTTQCNSLSPAATCPRTTVTVIQPSKSLVLAIKADAGTVGFNTTPVDVNLGETVSLSWKSTDPISNCKGYSDQGVYNWDIQTNGGTPKAPISGSTESGVQVAPAATNYFMSCDIYGIPTYSNIVTANVKSNGSASVVLMGRKNGTSNGWNNVVTINQGETVDLKWYSTNNAEATSCTAIAPTTPNASNWQDGQTKPGFTAAMGYTQSELGILAPTNPTIYKITCETTRGPATSGEVRVIVNPVASANLMLEIKLTGDPDGSYGPSVSVPQTNPLKYVSLRWSATAPLSPNSCRSSSSPSQYWPPAGLADPTNSVDGVNLDRTPFAVTTYTVTCTKTDGTPISASAIAISQDVTALNPTLTIDGPTCVQNDGVAFDLGWSVTGGNGGSVSLTNDGGQQIWNQSYTLPPTSKGYSGFHVTNPSATMFTLTYFDADGNSYGPVKHMVTIDSACTQSPRKNWFFRFFER